ncbi:hypothetical protein CF386_10030 [Paraphotobacterium marinum]|uniref:Outer membrane protein beta-barrel domain-containing protein n=1 Tax=Paraphotobacterium marinum TaxID=1755811 RepID=A0A220VGD8_9GAMM|nr:porin family protein [Paraphotobacterium marinum]ASK79389.1 hypothetical protein CF386_10030 [Paraphotobacterium marinum]
MKKISLGLLIASALVSSSAFAFEAGPYMGVEAGYGWTSKGNASASTKQLEIWKKDNRDSASAVGGVHLGYLFPVTDFLAIGPELGWTSFFEDSKSGTFSNSVGGKTVSWNNRIDYYSALLVARVALTDSLSVYGKAGAAYVQNRLEQTGTTPDANYSSYNAHQWRPEAAVGVGFGLTDSLTMNVQYTHVFGKDGNEVYWNQDQDNNVLRTDTLTLGLDYAF